MPYYYYYISINILLLYNKNGVYYDILPRFFSSNLFTISKKCNSPLFISPKTFNIY